MKKIGILSILILCLVVGGVYATWDYAYGSANLNQQTNVAVNLTASTSNGHKGNIVGNGVSNISIYIDDIQPKDLMLDNVTGDGQLSLKFVPAASASADIKQKGIVMQYSVEPTFVLEEFKYSSKTVYTAVDSEWKDFNAGEAGFTADLTGEMIANCITIDNTIKLATLQDYEKFNSEVASRTFKVTIREKPPVVQ